MVSGWFARLYYPVACAATQAMQAMLCNSRTWDQYGLLKQCSCCSEGVQSAEQPLTLL